jgi:hypothetical protein
MFMNILAQICFNYLQQQFYLVKPTMKSLSDGVKSDAIFKLLKVLIECQQKIFYEATRDTSNIGDITDQVSTDRQLFKDGESI